MNNDQHLARSSIQQLMAKYTLAGDEYDASSIISCFARDAVLEFDYFPGKGQLRLEGISAIEQHVTDFFEGIRSGHIALPGKYARHHLTTCKIDYLPPDCAEAKTYCIVFTANGAEHTGFYTDRFRKVDEQWLIEYRRWSVDS